MGYASDKITVESIDGRDIVAVRLHVAPDFEDRGEVKIALEDALAAPESRIVVDLTNVQRLMSVYIGTFVDIKRQAEEKKKTMSLIARPDLAKRIKDTVGSDKLDIMVASK